MRTVSSESNARKDICSAWKTGARTMSQGIQGIKMLKVRCIVDNEELNEPGAILLSPPDKDGRCRKYHICKFHFKFLRCLMNQKNKMMP